MNRIAVFSVVMIGMLCCWEFQEVHAGLDAESRLYLRQVRTGTASGEEDETRDSDMLGWSGRTDPGGATDAEDVQDRNRCFELLEEHPGESQERPEIYTERLSNDETRVYLRLKEVATTSEFLEKLRTVGICLHGCTYPVMSLDFRGEIPEDWIVIETGCSP